MHEQNLITAAKVRQANLDLTVEPASSHKRIIQDFLAIGGCHHNHCAIGAETVHFHQ
jgi:hypothetical protein